MLGKKLRKIRKEANLTIEELAKILSKGQKRVINISMISNWENDKVEPTTNTIRKYCNLFNVSMDWLLDIIVDENKLTNKNKLINQITEQLDKLNEEQLNKINEMIKIIIK